MKGNGESAILFSKLSALCPPRSMGVRVGVADGEIPGVLHSVE